MQHAQSDDPQDCAMCAAPSSPRTFLTGPDDCNHEYRNIRYEKYGPRGAIWEQACVRMCGPPRRRQKGFDSCWLCGSERRSHRRTWTRPSWRRTVVTTHAPGTAPPGCDVTTLLYNMRPQYEVVRREVDMPPSELPMYIYACPRGCDDDEELRALLAATEHGGPVKNRYRW